MMILLALVMSDMALAQVRQGSWTPVVESMERGYSSISYWTNRDDEVEIGGGRISIEHGKPKWPAALEEKGAFDQATVSKLWRLGNNKWTTLDTQLPLRFGGRNVEPGIRTGGAQNVEGDRVVRQGERSGSGREVDVARTQEGQRGVEGLVRRKGAAGCRRTQECEIDWNC